MRAALGAVLAAFALLVGGPAPVAWAHADLVSSTPADGAVLASVPREMVLGFSEDLLADTVVISVTDDTGMTVRVLSFTVEGPDVTISWPPGLPGRAFDVNYRVVSQDGHPISGTVSFTVDDAGASAVATTPAPAPASAETAQTAEPASTAPIAAIAAGLGVGIAVGFVLVILRRRRRA